MYLAQGKVAEKLMDDNGATNRLGVRLDDEEPAVYIKRQ